MAELRKPNLERARRKANARDRKYLTSYRKTADRVNWILTSRGVFLDSDRRRQLVANVRSGHITMDYVRDQTDRWQKQQRLRALDRNRGTQHDGDLVAIRKGYSAVLNRVNMLARQQSVPLSDTDAARMARGIITGEHSFWFYRKQINRVGGQLDPEGNVKDIKKDLKDKETPLDDYDFDAAVKGMFPFLAPELVKAFVKGWTETGDPETGLQQMRDSEHYERYFPGNQLSPGVFAMTEAEYMSYKEQAKDLMREYDIPAGFYDDDADIGKLIKGQVRLSQLEERIRKGYQAALQAPREVRQELRESFGVGVGSLAAFWLDPKKGEDLLQRQFTEAQIRGAARTSGYGRIDLEQSELLADYGVGWDEAQEGFSALVEGKGLFEGMIGSREDDIDVDEQLGATFLGDAEARERIKRRMQSRIAAFSGGGGGATSQKGNLGLRDSE